MKTMKKVLALILSVLMIGSSVVMAIPAFAAATDIASADDFNAISDGGEYKLTADITINATLAAKSNITFDGNGHSITLASGMTNGAFAKLTGSTVKNLTVKAENGAVMKFSASTAGAAGVVGDITSTTLENVTNEASITIASGTSWFGGIVGNVRAGCKLINCVNKGNLSAGGGEYTGGIAGVNFADATYDNCKNYGNIHTKKGSARNSAGGLIGYLYVGNSSVEITNCISLGNITSEGGSELLGAFAGQNDNVSTLKKFENSHNFTNVGGFGNNGAEPNNATAMSIAKADDLKELKAGAVYTVTADFECAGGYTLPEGALINGNGKTITLKGATNGLFKTSGETIIKDLIIAGDINATANGEGGIGALIGTANGAVTLSNITNNANITVSGTGYTGVGGFIGEVGGEATITACNNSGVISSTSAPAGGIVGKVAAAAKSVMLVASNNFGACKSATAAAKAGICGVNEIGDALVLTDSKDYSNDTEVKAVTLKLKDEISMYFYIGEAAFAGAEEVKVTVSEGYTATLLDTTAVIDGLTCKIYSVDGIEANRFGDAIKLTVDIKRDGETYTAEKTYSVKDYCMDQLTSDSADSALKQICIDMIKYGEAAQISEGNDDNLIGDELTEAMEALATKVTPNVAANEYKDIEVNFKTEIAPVVKFKAANGVKGTVATVKCGDATVTVNSFVHLGDGVYAFKLDGLSASCFMTPIAVEVKTAAGETQSFSFTVAGCAADMIANKKSTHLATAALKYINSVYTYLYDVTTYNIEKYAAPVWEGNVVYAETAFVREDKDDYYPAPISLLYPIDEIISVRSADMKTIYKEGVDYRIEDGKLVVIMPEDGGHIRVLPYFSNKPDSEEAYTYDKKGTYGTSSPDGETWYYWRDPMYTDDKEGGISKWTVSVTYKHSGGESVITTPTDQSDKFQAMIEKIEAGEEITVTSLGDSITRGCSASLNHREGAWGPKAPAYNQMFCDYLEAAYGAKVTHKNLAVDGKTSSWGNEAAQINSVIKTNPDILILAFGMNEGGLSPEQHVAQTKSIIDKVQAECPDTYVIVVSTCLLGQGYSASNQNRPFFGDALEKAFKDTEKVIVANVTKADVEMEGYDTVNETNHTGPKCYEDLTGSGSNHPNDFMHRIYLQVMIQAAFGENKFAK